MDISIREHIINNFKEDSEESIYDAIDESVKNGEEVTLPGLGVFMSIIWENSNDYLSKGGMNYVKIYYNTHSF